MKTLKDVVELIIGSIYMPQFSAYDITGLVRHYVEHSQKEKFNIRLSPPHSSHWYDIRHEEVKEIINTMFKNGTLERTLSGHGWFLYKKTATSNTRVGGNKATGIAIKNKSSLADMVFSYLSKRSGWATAKQVQSALKRKGNFLCSEIVSIRHPKIKIELNTSDSLGRLSVNKNQI